MKKFLLFLLLIIVAGAFLIKAAREEVRHDLNQPISFPSITKSPTPTVTKQVKGIGTSSMEQSLFVPYWTLTGEKLNKNYDEYFYFGITPSNSGIDKKEAGFIGLDKFNSVVPKKGKKELVVRMLDADSNFAILKDSAEQKSIINDAVSIARKNGFDGVTLDLEISAVPFDSLVKQINDFTSVFYSQTKKNNLQFGLMFYGDTFYRLRPFDIKTLSKNADNFLIMSYDFSKSRGNPGPNFPLKGNEVYGYDISKMSDDFLQFLPADKTDVVLGLFGYDWIVDDKGNAVSSANPLTDLQIQKQFLTNCTYKDCDIKRKNDSAETEITYTDLDNKKHVVWFEDMESIAAKEKYLKTRGINNFGLWANSYF